MKESELTFRVGGDELEDLKGERSRETKQVQGVWQHLNKQEEGSRAVGNEDIKTWKANTCSRGGEMKTRMI